MANFCYSCVTDMFGIPAEKNDLTGICKEDQMFPAICESCGPGFFDHEGKRVEQDDKES
jgi:hypothetical protein